MTRWLTRAVLAGGLALATSCAPAEAEPLCPGRSEAFFVTGYLRHSPPMNPLTADGTPIWTPEPIVAASYDLDLGDHIDIEGLGRFRVADRFGDPDLYRRIDVAVWTLDEAYSLTGTYCARRVE